MRPPRSAALAAAFALSLVATSVVGCAPQYIPNTDVEDTSENHRILEFCEKYRHSVEERDVDALLAMVSPRYFETGGNAKSNDDIDYGGLRAYLTTKFKMTKAIRYEIRYRKISEQENRIINVDFTYTASFQIPTAKGDEWKRSVRDDRLQLIREDDSYKILAGM